MRDFMFAAHPWILQGLPPSWTRKSGPGPSKLAFVVAFSDVRGLTPTILKLRTDTCTPPGQSQMSGAFSSRAEAGEASASSSAAAMRDFMVIILRAWRASDASSHDICQPYVAG